MARRLTPEARITVLTGAGVSAASGVPTFRGPAGLWRQFRPEELATPQAFARDPRLVWEWYEWRRSLIAACRPNRAHEALAAWSRRFPRFTLITQNVDGMHEAAGTSRVLRLHGSIWETRCARPCAPGAEPWEDARPSTGSKRADADPDSAAASPSSAVAGPSPVVVSRSNHEPDVPRCPHCGGLARPAVVWFGESLDASIVARASAATACDVFFAVGTSAVVYPAAGLVHEARRRGAYTVEINPEATGATGDVDVAIAQPAEVALHEIDAMIGS